jgi:hypothetical protein
MQKKRNLRIEPVQIKIEPSIPQSYFIQVLKKIRNHVNDASYCKGYIDSVIFGHEEYDRKRRTERVERCPKR